MKNEEFTIIIKKLFNEKLNIDLSQKQINDLYAFMVILIEENEKYNLTAITEPTDIIYKHFLDSCMLLLYDDEFSEKRFIDIGCGAGFPSIPLSIVLPNSEFLLVDSVNKKVNFIKLLIEKLHLENVKAIYGRAEELSKEKKLIGSFDYNLSRAVSSISTDLEYCSQFLKNGGSSFIYKMKDSREELLNSQSAQKLLKFKYINEKEYELSNDSPKRIIYQFNKESETPKKYPRKAGIPSKNPL